MNIDKRFMAKVNKCPSTGCWLWTGALTDRGYGVLTRGLCGKKRNYRAHRFSYEMHNGPIHEDLCVLHKCDVRNCVNPDHLFLGTYNDNVKDCIAKGRRRPPSGEQHGNAKLLDADVISIRLFLNLGAKPQAIAEAYGVSRQSVSDIKCRRRRRQLSQPINI